MGGCQCLASQLSQERCPPACWHHVSGCIRFTWVTVHAHHCVRHVRAWYQATHKCGLGLPAPSSHQEGSWPSSQRWRCQWWVQWAVCWSTGQWLFAGVQAAADQSVPFFCMLCTLWWGLGWERDVNSIVCYKPVQTKWEGPRSWQWRVRQVGRTSVMTVACAPSGNDLGHDSGVCAKWEGPRSWQWRVRQVGMTSVMTVACAPSGHPGACFLTAEMLNCLSETKLGGGGGIFCQKMKWLCLFWR